MKEISLLSKRIGIDFADLNFLEQAVVHRSFLNEHPDFHLDHNERLEFLGDAVLELVVTQYLYNSFPNPEGELTNWRAALVNAIMLAKVAEVLGVEEYLHLSKGESKDSGTKARQYILANALEAIIGAIYLDSGYDNSKKFIMENIVIYLPEILGKKLYQDPKSQFQEISQEKLGITPSYKVLKESGPDHAREFLVGVYLEKEKIADGIGMSKQEAQVEAAANGLKAKNW